MELKIDSTDEMENDIERELKKLEQIFDDENYLLESSNTDDRVNRQTRGHQTANYNNRISNSNGNSNNQMHRRSKQEEKARESYTAYEIAAAEGDREELQDRLNMLLSKMEDYDKLAEQLNIRNSDLIRKNENLINENQTFRNQILELKASAAVKDSISNDMNRLMAPSAKSEHVYSQLEFKLAETRSQLARSQQSIEDLELYKDQLIQKLDEEELKRVHAEKERDAYSAAYEQSLAHFEKWLNESKKKSIGTKFQEVKQSLKLLGSPSLTDSKSNRIA